VFRCRPLFIVGGVVCYLCQSFCHDKRQKGDRGLLGRPQSFGSTVVNCGWPWSTVVDRGLFGQKVSLVTEVSLVKVVHLVDRGLLGQPWSTVVNRSQPWLTMGQPWLTVVDRSLFGQKISLVNKVSLVKVVFVVDRGRLWSFWSTAWSTVVDRDLFGPSLLSSLPWAMFGRHCSACLGDDVNGTCNYYAQWLCYRLFSRWDVTSLRPIICSYTTMSKLIHSLILIHVVKCRHTIIWFIKTNEPKNIMSYHQTIIYGIYPQNWVGLVRNRTN